MYLDLITCRWKIRMWKYDVWMYLYLIVWKFSFPFSTIEPSRPWFFKSKTLKFRNFKIVSFSWGNVLVFFLQYLIFTSWNEFDTSYYLLAKRSSLFQSLLVCFVVIVLIVDYRDVKLVVGNKMAIMSSNFNFTRICNLFVKKKIYMEGKFPQSVTTCHKHQWSPSFDAIICSTPLGRLCNL